ncbi:MAG: ClpXP protease specificity-enhancing factor SspB [Pseudomonadota bacterium]
MTDSIDYGNLMHRAMRGLINNVLEQVAAEGLPGAHHFFITFDTRHPDVEIAPWLAERYPEEMTVVMQHWYDDLVVTEDGFGVTLNFGDAPERLNIPYDALLTFVDPSVEFGLRFEMAGNDDDDDNGDSDEGGLKEAPMAEDAEPGDGEVVSLDKFRR